MDMPAGTLLGMFLQSTEANAKIDSIDSSQIYVSIFTGYEYERLQLISKKYPLKNIQFKHIIEVIFSKYKIRNIH